MNRTLSIPASGAPVAVPLGPFKHLSIRAADVAFQISFDGGYWQTVRQNDRFDKSAEVPLLEKVYFMAAGGIAATVTIEYALTRLGAQDTAQTAQLTSARGCGGSGIALTVAKALAIGGANYVYNAGNAVNLLAPNTVVRLPGMVNGKKRKTIYFNNRNSATDICIFDSAGGLWLYLKGGIDSPVFETSSDFYLGGMGDPTNNFIYCETFYELSNS